MLVQVEQLILMHLVLKVKHRLKSSSNTIMAVLLEAIVTVKLL